MMVMNDENRTQVWCAQREIAMSGRCFPSRIGAVCLSFHSIICLEEKEAIANQTRLDKWAVSKGFSMNESGW